MDPPALSAVLTTLRDAGWPALLVRLAVLAGCAVALGATVVAPWDAPDALVVVALVVTAACVGLPDTLAPLTFSLAVSGSVGLRGEGSIDGYVIVAALGLLVVHVSAALAAAAPLPSTLAVDVIARWAKATGALAGLTLAAAGVLAAMSWWGPAGSLGATVGALLLLAVLALRWSSEA
jgi:hypothetical protein